jgi:hypothetical protein
MTTNSKVFMPRGHLLQGSFIIYLFFKLKLIDVGNDMNNKIGEIIHENRYLKLIKYILLKGPFISYELKCMNMK